MAKSTNRSIRKNILPNVFFFLAAGMLVSGTGVHGSTGDRSNGWTLTELVSSESTENSTYPCIAVDKDGSVHAVWQDRSDYGGSGSDGDIFYKKKPHGGSWTVTEVVSTESTGESSRPCIVVDNGGSVHVAWYDDTDYGGSGGDTDVFYKKKPDGGSWSLTEVVSTESSGGSFYPSIAADSGGTVHVAWQDITNYGGSGSDGDIFYKKKPDGGSWSLTEVVSTESTSSSLLPSIAADTDWTVHVAWEDYTDYDGAGTNGDIFYKKKYHGVSWTVTEVVSTESTTWAESPFLTADGDNGLHVAWVDETGRGGSDRSDNVYYKSKPEGGGWTAWERVVTGTYPGFYGSSWPLGVDRCGTVHLVCPDGLVAAAIIYKKRSVVGGWSEAEIVSTESSDASLFPSLAVDADGTVHVAWDDATDYDGAGTDLDIFYKKKERTVSVLYVDDDNTSGPWYGTLSDPFRAIQDGIDTACDGDTVMVADGTYTGAGNKNLTFNGKAITVRSENGPARCIIDCEASGGGFTFNNNEGEDSVLMGLTIRNAADAGDWGCIYCFQSAPTLINNIIRDNTAMGLGGGICCVYCPATMMIQNNIITGNSTEYGGGIYLYMSSPTLVNNTVNGNTASSFGGGIYMQSSDPVITNTIFWGNDAPAGEEVYAASGSSPVITYCDIQGGYTGEGNIDADPLFVNGPLGGYYLSQIAAGQASTSPCVDTGSVMAEWPCVSNPWAGTVCGTTRTDLEPDLEKLDMGYHYPHAGISYPPGARFEWPPGDSAEFKRMD